MYFMPIQREDKFWHITPKYSPMYRLQLWFRLTLVTKHHQPQTTYYDQLQPAYHTMCCSLLKPKDYWMLDLVTV